MKPFNLSSLVFLFLLAMTTTCDKHEPEPEDPCKDAKPFNAEFFIKEAVGDSSVITDNVLLYASVTFDAVENYDSYQWRVGNDQNISSQKKYSLLFTETVNNVQVRLIATRKAIACFPNDKTIDTVYHTFSVVPWKDAAIIGKYAGSYTRTPTLKDTVEIRYAATADDPEPFGRFQVININRGCNKDGMGSGGLTYMRGNRAFALVSSGGVGKLCSAPLGLMKLVDDNTLVANITYADTTKWGTTPLPRVSDKFNGKRIQ